MIRYTPPKSQVWGHQVGRLAATAIVEKSLLFLEQQCVIINGEPSELTLAWPSAKDASVSEAAEQVDRVLGAAKQFQDVPDGSGLTFRRGCWQCTTDQLPAVAAWFDRHSELLARGDAMAQCVNYWIFTWRSEPPPRSPLESAGGMFGVHLGKPHRITTMFTFRDIDQYASVKAELARLGLVELSDRHLRPKDALVSVEPRMK